MHLRYEYDWKSNNLLLLQNRDGFYLNFDYLLEIFLFEIYEIRDNDFGVIQQKFERMIKSICKNNNVGLISNI